MVIVSWVVMILLLVDDRKLAPDYPFDNLINSI
jgi:hypothetical protein